MNEFHFAWNHVWWFAGAIVLVAICPIIFRSKVKRILRLCKALTTDSRLPRPVRGLFGFAIAIKTVPIPDFGVDEVALLVGAILLFGPYHHVWRAIREETREAG